MSQMALILFTIAACGFLNGAQAVSEGKNSIFGDNLIGEPCEVLDDCVGRWPEVDCSPQKICVCGGGFIQKSDLTNCLRIVNEIGDPCEEPQQCQAGNLGQLSECKEAAQCSHGAPGNYSYCPDRTCRCRQEAVLPPSRSRCLRKATFVGDICEVSLQCAANLGLSYCSDKSRCRCEDTAYPNHNNTRCLLHRYLNDECTDVEECSHIQYSASCLPVSLSNPEGRRICKCNPGYINPAGVNDACYALAVVIGFPCNLDPIQCSSIANSYCKNSGSRKVCECNSNYVLSVDATRCIAVENNLNAPCEVNEQCKVNNSLCLPSSTGGSRLCQCKQEYIESERVQNQCLPVVGSISQPCTEDVQCSAGLSNNSECSGSRCSCIAGYDMYRNQCYRSLRLGDRCALDEECKAGVNNLAFCNRWNSSCACSSIAIQYNMDTCYRAVKIGDNCSSDLECSLSISGDVFCAETCFCLLSTPDLLGYTCSAIAITGNFGLWFILFLCAKLWF